MTLTLRSRLTLLYAAVFGVLLVATSVVFYRVLAYQLDADVSASLSELTTGLHGYLKFGNPIPAIVFDPTDPAEAAFVEEAIQQAFAGQVRIEQFDVLHGRDQRLAFDPGVVFGHRMRHGAFRRIAGIEVGHTGALGILRQKLQQHAAGAPLPAVA